MSFAVLQNMAEVDRARDELIARGVPKLEPHWLAQAKANARRLRLPIGPSVGDYLKSWDVLATIRFLDEHGQKDAAIADLGAYGSEVLIALDRLGYTNLTGIDLNPAIKYMPATNRVRYVVSDYRATGLPAESLDAITSISVMEHGYEASPTFTEIARLLRPLGYFIASFDYWPDKISVGDLKLFGMSWTIFSEQEVLMMIDEAAKHGLVPVGAIQTGATERAISHRGFDYTFGWMAFQKQA